MSIYKRLYPWQKNIVDKFKNRQSFGLFLDMGLGKTPLSLAMAEANSCDKLIIITLNGKALESDAQSGSWKSWVHLMYNGEIEALDKRTWNFHERNQAFIINYESLFERGSRKTERVTLRCNVESFIDSCKNQNVAIIVDESHKIKNLQSLQTCAIMKIKQRLERKNNVFTYLLTGTPFTTGYIDLYAQLKLLGCEMTKGTYVDNYCIRGNVAGLLGWQQPIIGYKNVDQLYSLVHRYALTIKSEEIVDLPEKVFTYIETPLSKHFDMFVTEQMKAKDIQNYANSRGVDFQFYTNNKVNNPFYRNIDYPDINFLCETTGVFWLRARQLSIGFQGNENYYKWFDYDRLNKLENFLQNNEDNYILFYNYTPELIAIYDICDKLGYNVDVYCGPIKSEVFYNKYANETDEQKLLNKKNVIIANFASGSTGKNWQEYNKCIIFSLPLYKDYEQGIKRIHRLGQKNTTFYYIFQQRCWLDNSMIKALHDSIDYSLDMFNSDLQRINEIKEKK